MKERHNNKLAHNNLQLQNLIKRDPASYYDEFHRQYQHFLSLFNIFKLKPEEYDKELEKLTVFVAQTSPCYPDDAEEFPNELMTLLSNYQTVLDPTMRMCFCRALILIRNRGVIQPTELITLFFGLLRCQDKILRNIVQIHIITDIKTVNLKHKHKKFNSDLQNFMFKMLLDSNATAVKMSLDIMIQLFKKNVWNDEKTANGIASACFSKFNKVKVAALHFFLGSEIEEETGSGDETEEEVPLVNKSLLPTVTAKARKRQKVLERLKSVFKQQSKNKKNIFDFTVIRLLHDPQGLAEKLLSSVKKNTRRIQIKILIMNLISRLIGVHKLLLFNYYFHLQPLLKVKQLDVTNILMFAAQAAHENVPPTVMEPVVRTIVKHFVTDRNSPEAITVGLNTIREICIRCPLAMDEVLLQDIVLYTKYKNKNVAMAAKSFISLFRNIDPKMLKKAQRSKQTLADRERKVLQYGELNAKTYIPGAEVLQLTENYDEADHSDANETDDGSDDDNNYWEDDDSKFIENEEEVLDDRSKGKEVEEEEKSCASDVEIENNKSADESEACSEINDLNGIKELPVKDPVAGLSKASEEITDNNELKKMNAVEKAEAVSLSRILTQEEFQKVNAAQLTKEVLFANKKRLNPDSIEELHRGELVSLKHIEHLHKKLKSDYNTRLNTMMEGKSEKETYVKKFRKNPLASKTQVAHNKNKAFMMIKHKVKKKIKKSFQEKQRLLRAGLKKFKKRKH